MHRFRTAAAAALLALPLLAAPPALAAQEAERFSIGGDAVAIYNLAGSVRIERGTGANVVVEVRRGGEDAGRLNIERRDVEGRSALVVRYPDDEVVYRTERWNGSTNLQVRSDGTFFGDGSRGNRMTIRSSGRGLEAHADLRILVPEGKRVDVRLGVGDVRAANVSGDLDIDVASAAVQTSATRGRLRIDTGSGRVLVSDADGNVSIDTGSGAVEVNGMRGDELGVDTGSGSVSGSAITARKVTIDTGSGRIDVTQVSATDLELDTGSGGVSLELTSDVERLRIDTGSGAVTLVLAAGTGATIEAESGSGGVSYDIPINVTHRERNSLNGRIGDGRGSIELDTGSGGIRIRSR